MIIGQKKCSFVSTEDCLVLKNRTQMFSALNLEEGCPKIFWDDMQHSGVLPAVWEEVLYHQVVSMGPLAPADLMFQPNTITGSHDLSPVPAFCEVGPRANLPVVSLIQIAPESVLFTPCPWSPPRALHTARTQQMSAEPTDKGIN
jgi:hypothetical protein